MGKRDDDLAKTWTPQQIPDGVADAKPSQDKEPAAEPPKSPEKK